MITLSQLTEMLDMQEKLEIRIDGKNWRDKGHDYRLCIHMECAEIIDHMGWKHWKHHDAPNYDVIAMELVDVWHFGMAYMLGYEDFKPIYLYEDIVRVRNDQASVPPKEDMIQLAIGLGYSMYNSDAFSLGNFMRMMELANMSWDQLYRLYIGKNILNWFRQDNGYQEGLYIKTWGGAEDNEHLNEIIDALGEDFSSTELVKCLSARYALAGH